MTREEFLKKVEILGDNDSGERLFFLAIFPNGILEVLGIIKDGKGDFGKMMEVFSSVSYWENDNKACLELEKNHGIVFHVDFKDVYVDKKAALSDGKLMLRDFFEKGNEFFKGAKDKVGKRVARRSMYDSLVIESCTCGNEMPGFMVQDMEASDGVLVFCPTCGRKGSIAYSYKDAADRWNKEVS